MRVAGETLTEDVFLGGKLKLLQSEAGFRAGLDSVLLPAAANVAPGEFVLDAGCGAGVGGLCLLARVGNVHLTGVDRSHAAIHLCTENATQNRFVGEFIEGDVFELPALVGRDVFDHVITNPPFHDPARERPSPNQAKAAAHGLGHQKPYDEALTLWVEACLAALKTKGRITLINRTEALPALLAALDGPAGEIVVVPLWPKRGQPAKRVIVTARKGSRTGAKLHPGFVLHEEGGSFTSEIEAALREGEALAL